MTASRHAGIDLPRQGLRKGERGRGNADGAPAFRDYVSCASIHWIASGVTGSVMSANSPCFSRNPLT